MRLAFDWLARGGSEARLSTLIFHRVLAEPDPLFPGEVDVRMFDAICRWVHQWFNVLPLEDAVRRLSQGTLPTRPLAITFDDGYADNHDLALPILQRHGLCATFFVTTGFLDGGRMWNDTLIEVVRCAPGPHLDLGHLGAELEPVGRLDLSDLEARRRSVRQLVLALKYLPPTRRASLVDRIAAQAAAALPDDLMMTSAQVRALHRAGMSIGAHTLTHPILARLDDQAALAEISESRRELSQIIGAPIPLFAYPNGKPQEDYVPRDVQLAQEAGFLAAFTTSPGAATAASALFELPRYTPWRRERWSFGLQLARNLMPA